MADRSQMTAYLVGGGIASLATAAFLIKEAGMPGKNIFIFEESEKPGGSLGTHGKLQGGYSLSGGRILEEGFHSTFELLSFIPSLADSTRTVKQEIFKFHQDFFWNGKYRLVENGHIHEMTSLGFSTRDRLDIAELFAIPEDLIGQKSIDEWFRPAFFKTDFWYLWATTFVFKPNHSAVEFKRYLQRYVHFFSEPETLPGIFRTQYNQYDEIIRPLVRWLSGKGVNFELDSVVTDLDFIPHATAKTVQAFHYFSRGTPHRLVIAETDLVFVSNGSMTANMATGSMDEAPILNPLQTSSAWALWKTLSRKFDNFGKPDVFQKNLETAWQGFTVTATDLKFFELLQKVSEGDAGKGGFMTLKDSHWLLSLVVNRQPHFYDQPEDMLVWWGFGLHPEKEGNFIQKKMGDCTGREILCEVLTHLGFLEELLEILATSECRPSTMPYVGTPFAAREKGDRPEVIPKGATNMAFIGQFTEVPGEVAFTIEYSVRSAQMAVYQLLHLEKELPPITKNHHDIGILFQAFKNLNKAPTEQGLEKFY